MLILVAVTITMAVNGGLFDYARRAGQETNQAVRDEQQLAGGKVEVDGLWYNTVDDYIAENPIPTSEDFFEFVDEEAGEITIVLDETENHKGIGYYYIEEDEENRTKILSEEHVVIPRLINNVEVKKIRGAHWDYEEGEGGGFLNASNLKTVIIPDTVIEIERGAFRDCGALKKVILSENLERIGRYAFQRCTSLTEITIPSSVTYIGCDAFSSCESLEKVIILNGVEGIEDRIFVGCTNLTEITIPGSLTSISYEMFWQCTNLKNVTISEGVETIDTDAFYRCDALKEITIPSSVTTISSRAFRGCTNLTKITLAKGSILTVPEGNWGATNATIVREQ